MVKVINQIENIVTKIVGAVLILILAALSCCCILQVFTRYVLNDSLTWTEELARFCFIWGGILGIVLAFREKTHARIMILVDRFPKKISGFLEFFANLLAVYMGYLMIRYGWEMTVSGMNVLSPQLNIPMGLVYASVPITGLLVILFMLFALIRKIEEEKERRRRQ